MTIPNRLDEIIERIQTGNYSQADIARDLKDLFSNVSSEERSHLAKYNIQVDEAGGSVHFGDNYYGLNSEDSKAFLEAAQAFTNFINSNKPKQETDLLTRLEINIDTQVIPQIIPRINQKLVTIETFSKGEEISEQQSIDLLELRKTVREVNSLNEKLKELDNQAQNLLEELSETLISQQEALVKSLKEKQLTDLDHQIYCLDQKIQLVNQFITSLSDGRDGATWLNQHRERLARSIGKEALDGFPDVRDGTSEKQIDDFYFTISQFIENICHALNWGRYNILDYDDIPLVFQKTVYLTAFNSLKNKLPRHLTEQAREQVIDMIDYLIQQISGIYQ